ncbi:hypothetical protein NMD1_00764 [Novosphingobium sp. MD-1]|nr:hypothetical protein NMD1_00764 [Novosphingobium sp. MD-1]
MQRHADNFGRARGKVDVRAVRGNVAAALAIENGELGVGQFAHRNRRPAAAHQQVLIGGHAGQPLFEALEKHWIDVARSPGKRLHHRQHVLGAVIHFHQQDADLLFLVEQFGHVGVGTEPRQDHAALIPDRLRARKEPAIAAVTPAQGKRVFPFAPGGDVPCELFTDTFKMIGVLDSSPPPALHVLEPGAGVVVPSAVVPVQPAIGRRDPRQLRNVVRQHAEAALAFLERFGGGELVGHVARDLARADNPAFGIEHGRNRQRNADGRAILAQPDRFEVPHALSALDAADDRVFLALAIGRNQTADGLADHFRFFVPEDSRCGRIPAYDRAVELLADNGVIRRLDDRGKMLFRQQSTAPRCPFGTKLAGVLPDCPRTDATGMCSRCQRPALRVLLG